jgi:hypothetical protein
LEKKSNQNKLCCSINNQPEIKKKKKKNAIILDKNEKKAQSLGLGRFRVPEFLEKSQDARV